MVVQRQRQNWRRVEEGCGCGIRRRVVAQRRWQNQQRDKEGMWRRDEKVRTGGVSRKVWRRDDKSRTGGVTKSELTDCRGRDVAA